MSFWRTYRMDIIVGLMWRHHWQSFWSFRVRSFGMICIRISDPGSLIRIQTIPNEHTLSFMGCIRHKKLKELDVLQRLRSKGFLILNLNFMPCTPHCRSVKTLARSYKRVSYLLIFVIRENEIFVSVILYFCRFVNRARNPLSHSPPPPPPPPTPTRAHTKVMKPTAFSGLNSIALS